MTRVTFYVLAQGAVSDRHQFACRLTEKAVNQGSKVMIATNDETETKALDELLWQFRAESFVPHHTYGDTLESPVLLSHDGDDIQQHDLLINLRRNIPGAFSRFARLVEIVIQDPADKQLSRKHFTYFKERGYEIETHNIG
ncbi:DNA polymerase III subunit chi [Teredinibacter turnerae]|uniref:DNA polymerase III subunit chi n=1 Tax=Teredinibacter turnerae TaxID=2426 RepID=UPI00048CD022|nr:DNA polymerase III subunit chi [Teredinibacter turnerae]